mgnify:CR=1 FL=1
MNIDDEKIFSKENSQYHEELLRKGLGIKRENFYPQGHPQRHDPQMYEPQKYNPTKKTIRCDECGVKEGYGRHIVTVGKVTICNYCWPLLQDKFAKKFPPSKKKKK